MPPNNVALLAYPAAAAPVKMLGVADLVTVAFAAFPVGTTTGTTVLLGLLVEQGTVTYRVEALAGADVV
jgi:hypothetical protein